LAGTHVAADPGGVIGRHLAIRERQVSLERELAIGVGRNRREATLRNALSDIASFGLSREDAVAIARDMQQTVKNAWQDLFRRHGFTTVEIERLRTCFIACDEPIENENDAAV
jgi:hypothetical protein